MLPLDILQEIQRIQFVAGKQASEILAGNYRSAFKGRGLEFDEVREYVVGDDVRAIDWNVTARMQSPYIKIFHEERQLTIMLLVDVSASQLHGSSKKSKNRISAELSAVIAFLATKNSDKVGLLLFSDRVEKYIPPQKGRAHIWNVIRTILTFRAQGIKTDPTVALDHILKLKLRKSMCFLISDFLTEANTRSLSVFKSKHDPVAVIVRDPHEVKLPNIGLVLLKDAETGLLRQVDLSSSSVRQQFEKQATERHHALIRSFQKMQIDHFEIFTHQSIVQPLVRFLYQRESKG